VKNTVLILNQREDLELDIGGRKTFSRFLVIEHDEHDVLLGLSWFKDNRVIVDPSSQALIYKGRNPLVVPLEHCSDETVEYFEDLYNLKIDYADEPDMDEDQEWNWSRQFDIKAEAELTEDQAKKFEKFKNEIRKMIASNYEELGSCNITKHKIRLMSDQIIFQHPFKKSVLENEKLQEECDRLLKANIIRYSNSPYSAPVFMVPKKNGKLRMVIDYRKLNAITVQEVWPLPIINEMLERLAGTPGLEKRYYSCIDLLSGFNQIELDEESKKYTAFSTHNAHYEYNRLPFGLRNGPAEFSRIMQMVFRSLEFVEVYLDDITIHSDSFDEHLLHLRKVFTKLNEANLKINIEKCQWISNRVKLLGHAVSASGVEMDENKISAIVERKPPKNMKDVQCFLGICNYYRRFIKDYSKISVPLVRLCKKDVKFEWDKNCQESFEMLKQKLVTKPILRQPDFNRKFYLFTDASNYAIGFVLSQIDPVTNLEGVIAYGGRTLKSGEPNYPISEKEALAIVCGVKNFRQYLYGCKERFVIVTDHSACKYIMNIQDATGRLARWAIYLQMYDFEIQYKKGELHANADALSRPPIDDEDIKQTSLLMLVANDAAKQTDPYDDDYLMFYLHNNKHKDGSSQKQVIRTSKLAKVYELKDDHLIYKHDRKILPKESERLEIIEKAHIFGHFQLESTVSRIRETHNWRGIVEDVKRFIKQCEVCLRHQKVRKLDHPAQVTNVTQLFEKIGMDLVFGLPVTEPENFKGILVITEYLSKMAYAVPIKSKTAEEMAQHIFRYICLYGVVNSVTTDQGAEWNNQLVNELLKVSGIEHKLTSSWRPSTNGACERLNQSLIEALSKHTENNQLDWPKWLPFVVLAYNTRVHSSTNFTP